MAADAKRVIQTTATSTTIAATTSLKSDRPNETQKNGSNMASAAVDAFGADVDDAEDEKLKALARKYEEKYAPKPNRVNKKMEDYIDLGMGYDETDPFIDNTDAYDELVPSTLTTQYGGFYINAGKLDFKEVQTDSSDELIDPAKRKKRQRLKEIEKEARKRRRLLMKVDGGGGDHAPKKRGRKPLDRTSLLDGALIKQKGKPPDTVAILLQQRKIQQQQIRSQAASSNHPVIVSSPSPSPSPPASNALKQGSSHSANVISSTSSSSSSFPVPPQLSRTQSVQLPTVHLIPEITIINDLVGTKLKSSGSQQLQQQRQPNALINDIIESVILASREQRVSINADYSDNAALVELVSSDSDNQPIQASSGTMNSLETETAIKLPDGLPDVLDEAVKQIKVAALKSGEGKCRFFSGEVNNMLLSIELMSRELSCSQRSTLFGHLASHLPCTKETLLKRAKKLRLEQADVKLHDLLDRLKKAIYEVMPTIEDAYKAKCLAVAKGTMNVSDASESSDEYWEEDGSPSPDEENMDIDDEDSKAICVRKKFLWNDKMRTLLCDAVQIKLRCFEISKTRTQSIDKYLRRFFDRHVKGLWPSGWMHSRKLMKESRLVHAHLTCRHRKNLFLGSKKFVLPPGTQMAMTAPKSEPLDSTTSVGVIKTSGPRVSAVSISSISTTASTSGVISTPVTTSSPVQPNQCNPPSSSPSLSVSPPTTTTTIGSVLKTGHSIVGVPSTKPTNHVFSLLRADNLVGTSTAEHLLGELISGALANFPNSSTVGKHSTNRNNFHESTLFTTAMNKCGSPAPSNNSAPSKGASVSKRTGSGIEETKVSFATPKPLTSKLPTPPHTNSSAERKSPGDLQVGVSILKDQHHHDSRSSHQHRWTPSQDLRLPTSKNSSSTHSVNNTLTSMAHKSQTSPMKVDMLIAAADCLGAIGSNSSKTSTSAPYHSLFDIQGAIERGLQGSSMPSSHSNHNASSSSSTSSKVSRSSNYTHYSDAPLNFSTSSRGAIEKVIHKSSASRNRITTSSPNLSANNAAAAAAVAVQNYITAFADKTHNSMRSVSLSQQQQQQQQQQIQTTKKFNAFVNQQHQQHFKSESQDFLEGIAAAVHEQHLRKSTSSFVSSGHRSRGSTSLSEMNNSGGSGGGSGSVNRHPSNVKLNHNHHHQTLPKVTITSGYSEPTHSIVNQVTTDVKARINRPTTSSP